MHPSATPPSGIHGVLSVLADAADEASGDRQWASSRLPDRLHWLDLSGAGRLPSMHVPLTPIMINDRDAARELAAVDAIRPGEHSLRLGWLWVAGTTTREDGEARRVFEPLITLPVTLRGGMISASGELELTPLIEDHSERVSLESALQQPVPAFGGGAFDHLGPVVDPLLLARTPALQAFAHHAAEAAGLSARELVPADAGPSTLADRDGLQIVVGLAIFAMDAQPDFSPAGSLRTWHQRVGTEWTALHALYLDRRAPEVEPGPEMPSPYALTAAQHRCVVESRREPLTVIAGAPGTGKTHTIAAIIGDAVARGRSVLVAAKSEATVEAISEIVDRRPGPEPVVFGSTQRRTRLAQHLAAGHPAPVEADVVEERDERLTQAVTRREQVVAEITKALEGLALLDDPAASRRLRDRVPGLSGADVSLFEVEELATRTGLTPPSWWRLGRRRRWSRLLDLLGVSVAPGPEDLRRAIALATASRHLHTSSDDLVVGLDWDGLLEAHTTVARAAGQWMEALARDERRVSRRVRAARGALATALRSGRAARRSKLAELGPAVIQALPVWVGTLGDIDDLLPMHPAMFDVVVLDEASSVDQPRAATALLRGRQAVVVGDPQQLRHVSFVPRSAVRDALARHLPGAPPELAAKLDIRQNSVFDVAAAAAPVRHLDEHFRSGAHLFDFVGRHLYGDRVRVATATPLDDDTDMIRMTRLEAERTAQKVVVEEVDWVMDRLAALQAEGIDSIGVVSPFRAQADAIEERALRDLGHRGIRALGLRVGTVHAFQGMERDVVLVSLGIGGGDGPTTWRFADDPHLFAVMATRARRRIEWVVSAPPPAGTLIERYLAQHDRPPAGQQGVGQADRWTAAVGGSIADAGVPVVSPYRTGHHVVDLCLVGADRFLAVETVLHPDGVDAHIRRHVELRQRGWPVVTTPPAAWRDRGAELAIRLCDALADLPPHDAQV